MSAIGIEQLKRFLRSQLSDKPLQAIRFGIKECKKYKTTRNDYDQVVPYIYPIVLDGTIERKWLQDELGKRRVQTGIHYQANHEHSYFKRKIRNLPVSERISRNILSLPLHTDLSRSDVTYVTDTLKEILQKK